MPRRQRVPYRQRLGGHRATAVIQGDVDYGGNRQKALAGKERHANRLLIRTYTV